MSKQEGVTNEKIMSFLVDMDERMDNMDERIADISIRMVTKDDLEMLRQEIKEEIQADIRKELKPFSEAIDRDARTIIGHEKQITVLERKAEITLK